MPSIFEKVWPSWRRRMYIIIFESDTDAGKRFDVLLLWAILLSVLTVTLESVAAIRAHFGLYLNGLEWFFTIIFTLEYLARIYCTPRPLKYIFSFFGLIDLLSVIPTYLSLIMDGAQYLLVLRSVRLMRIFRVLKMAQYLGGAAMISSALKASRPKIIVFLGVVLTVVTVVGTLMYLIEGPENGYSDIPTSIYWAIVTLTTVGYGDIAPLTPLGKFFASILMITGYGIIAVPTGIVTSEMVRQKEKEKPDEITCPQCESKGHPISAQFCFHCGASLKT